MDQNNTQKDSTAQQTQQSAAAETKFCSSCGEKVMKNAVVCPHCGCQIADMSKGNATAQPQIVINNSNQNQNQNAAAGNAASGNAKNKWVALLLCFFLGAIGAHKFYEGKILMGVVYLFTFGLFGIGVIIDFIALLFKPTTYYV